MHSLFASIKPIVTIKKQHVPRPDNIIFKLHYKVTFAILLTCTILVSSYSYIDSSAAPIQCMLDKGIGINKEIINNYCWISSTYTLPRHYEGVPGKDHITYGVGHHSDDDEKVYHAYYQWVPLFLTFQAILFYAPHFIWKCLEGGRMEKIIIGLQTTIESDNTRDEKISQLSGYLTSRINLCSSEHSMWAIKFAVCEVLNFVNVIFQMILTNTFLGGEFTTYGTKVLEFPYENPEDRVDPMSRIFPRMTKCNFLKFGGSGTIQKFDALCVLSMNIINEKIFIFLWFWFILLLIINIFNLIHRFLNLTCPSIRDRWIKLQNMGHLDGDITRANIDQVMSRMNYGDWLLMYYLANAMTKKHFGLLLEKLKDELDNDPPPKYPNYSDEDDEKKSNLSREGTLKSKTKLRNMIPLKNFGKSV